MFLLLVLQLVSASLLPIRVDPDNHYLLDAAGRVRFFHGTNVVQKLEPWYPEEPLLNVRRMQRMQEMGFNALRLGCQASFEFKQLFISSLILCRDNVGWL